MTQTAKTGPEQARAKLLFLAPSPQARGPIRGIAETLAESLERDGYSIRLASWGRRSDQESRFQRVFTLLQDTWRVRAMAADWQPDAVVLHTGSDWVAHVRDAPLLAALRLSGVRVIAEFHGSEVEQLAGTGHLAFKALSRFVARRVIGLLLLNNESVGVWSVFEPSVRTAAVQNPLTPLEGSRAAIRVIESHDPIRLVFVGRLIQKKGLQDVVRALAEVRRSQPVVLSVVGDGPDLARAMSLADELGVSECVCVNGHMDGAGVARELSHSDVMVFPSYHPEGFPTVVLEAMGAGLPIITTRRWGTADWLEPNVHAVYVPARDPHALAEAVVALGADVELRRRMSAANLERIGEFAPAVVAARYGASLDAMLGAAEERSG